MKALTLVKFTLAILFFANIASCKLDEIPEPETVVKAPTPTTPESPSVPATPPPAEAPGTPVPPPAPNPSVAGQLTKMKWAPLDYKLFEHSADGLLTKYVMQYNSVQGTDIVRRDEYTYTYNAAKQVASVSTKEGFKTIYTYDGDTWKEATTYDKLNRPWKKYEFTFNANKQLTQYNSYKIDLSENKTPEAKVQLAYNADGNLVSMKEAYFNAANQTFTATFELVFSNFDTRKHPHNGNNFGYILQPLTFWKNNPGKKEFLGSSSPIEHYNYTYNVHGYPLSKITTYTYEKPLPAMKVDYEY